MFEILIFSLVLLFQKLHRLIIIKLLNIQLL